MRLSHITLIAGIGASAFLHSPMVRAEVSNYGCSFAPPGEPAVVGKNIGQMTFHPLGFTGVMLTGMKDPQGNDLELKGSRYWAVHTDQTVHRIVFMSPSQTHAVVMTEEPTDSDDDGTVYREAKFLQIVNGGHGKPKVLGQGLCATRVEDE